MGYFIALFLILGITLSLSHLLRQSFSYILPLTNLSVITVLYIFGVFDALMLGGIVVVAVAVALLLFVAVDSKRRRDPSWRSLLTHPAILLFLAFAILQYVALFSMEVIGWDELTHWGLVVKNMFYTRTFGGTEAATTMFKGYPVASSLYLYFFQMFGTQFRPAQLFMAMNLLNVGFLLPVISKFKSLSQKTCGILLILACVLAFNPRAFFSIWNDSYLAILFGYILISYFCFDSPLRVLPLCLGVFVLTASKNTGVAFSLIALILITLDLLFGKKPTKQARWLLLLPLGMGLSILLSKLSWSLYLDTHRLGEAWNTGGITVSNLWNALWHPTDFQREVARRFWLEFLLPFSSTSNSSATPIPYPIDLVLFGILLWQLAKRTKNMRRTVTLAIGIFCTFFLYTLAMLSSFLFAFSQEEALLLTSYVRYMNTFVVGILLLLLSMLLGTVREREEVQFHKLPLAILGVLLAATLVTCPVLKWFMGNEVKPYQTFEQGLEQLADSDRIYAVSCGHSGYLKDYLYFRFLATPKDCSGLKIGGSPHVGDVWNHSLTAQDTLNAIQDGGYTVVYLHRIDDGFRASCGELFLDAPQEYTFYRFGEDGRLGMLSMP